MSEFALLSEVIDEIDAKLSLLRAGLDRLRDDDRAEQDALKEAGKNLLDKLQELHDNSNYLAVFQLADVHGITYNGPVVSKEMDALAAVIGKAAK